MYDNITGVILAGGQSKRMGVNKALLYVNGKRVIDIISDLMQSLFKNVIIISSEKDLPDIKLPLFLDFYKSKGPLSGIHTGLVKSYYNSVFVISCDLPLMNKDVVQYIIDFPSRNKIKIPIIDNYINYLCGIYNKKYINLIEETLKEKKFGVKDFLNKINFTKIDIEKKFGELSFLYFLNMNDHNDYKKVIYYFKNK